MTAPKEKVMSAIAHAQADLEEVMADLDKLSVFHPEALALTVHALNNFLTVTEGTVDLLMQSLRDYPDSQVQTWIQGLRHATDLMAHTTSQLLMGTSSSTLPKVIRKKLDFPTLVQRACNFYQRLANRKEILINFESHATYLYVLSDGVVAAAILDNLLSNALKFSEPRKQI